MWPDTLSGRLPIIAMVRHYHTIKLIGARPLHELQVPKDPRTFTTATKEAVVPSCVTTRFQELSRSQGYVNELVLTLLPVYSLRRAFSHDLHA